MFLKKSFLLIILSFCSTIYGQYDVEEAKKDSIMNNKGDQLVKSLKENLYVGSGLNIALGGQLYIYASPQIGYEFMPKVSAGLLSLFQYRRNQYSGGQFELQSSFGGGIFVRYKPFDFLVLESSFNLYKVNYSSSIQTIPIITNAKSLMLGIGFARSLGKKSYFNAILSYDFLKDPFNPESTILRTNNFRLHYKFGVIIYPFN